MHQVFPWLYILWWGRWTKGKLEVSIYRKWIDSPTNPDGNTLRGKDSGESLILSAILWAGILSVWLEGAPYQKALSNFLYQNPRSRGTMVVQNPVHAAIRPN